MAFATAFQSNAFQNNAFQIASTVPLYPGDGGRAGYYRRPLKYIRDGKVVDLNETETPTVDEIIGSFELTPAMLEALMAQMQIAQPPQVDPMASIMAKMAQLTIQRELDAMADDDTVLVLLLS